MFDKLHEECGVFGIYGRGGNAPDAVETAYYALYALQHRGQESCGIAVSRGDGAGIGYHRDAGLVNEVFTKDVTERLRGGKIAVAHVRYGTTGNDARLNAQPLVINHVKGSMALAHNGNLTNDFELRKQLELSGSIFHTSSDTEVIAYIITKYRLVTDSIEEAVSCAMDELCGAYSLVIMTPNALVAARDPLGFRPLCIGKIGESYVFASESCALDSIDATFVRDVRPGEVVFVDENGLHSIKTRRFAPHPRALCVFELIYFARPDSVIDGVPVHHARIRAGALLAQECPANADVVIGVPDSGIDAAIGFSKESNIPYSLGFIKNKYIARTFIQPTQQEREAKVRIKLNPINSVVEGKRVVLIDDSIVRGTTSAHIVHLLRDSGAREVHLRSSAPKFMYACYFGTDVDSQEKLIAWNHSEEEMARIIGVDSIGFLSIESVVKLTEKENIGFCTACFSSDYPSPPPTALGRDKYDAT